MITTAMASILLMAGCNSAQPPPMSVMPPTSAAPTFAPSLSPAEQSMAEAIRLRELLGLESGADYVRRLAGDAEAVRRGGSLYGFPVTEAEFTLLKARAEDAQTVAKVTKSYGTDHPATWAGQYIETETGIVVALFTGDVGVHKAALARLLSLDARFDVRPARWTLAELKALDKDVLRQQEWFETIGASFRGTGVSQRSNRVEVWVASDNPNIADQVITHFGAVGRMAVTVVPAPWTGEWGSLRVLVRDPAGRPIENLDCTIEGVDPSDFDNEGYGQVTQETGLCWYPTVPATGLTIVVTGLVGPDRLEFGRAKTTIVAGQTTDVTVTVVRKERPN